ncbi:nitrilase-related carbon-nitrogen hydrolase [Planctomycetota bacterium]
MPKIAVVQQPPVLLDRSATLERVIHFTQLCAAEGAELIVFPEAFIPGYPAWIWRLRPGGDMGLTETLHAVLFENAVSLGNDDLAPLYDVAKKKGVTIICGMNERGDESSRTTLYNTVVRVVPSFLQHRGCSVFLGLDR